jgi:PilZ domain
MIERRDSPRRNTCFFRAFVYFENSSTAIDCIVRDISDTGARLQFPKPQNLTEIVDLHIPVKGQSFHAEMRWHDGDEIGVAFHASPKADTADITLDRRMDRLEAEISMLKHAVKHLQKHTDKNTEAA